MPPSPHSDPRAPEDLVVQAIKPESWLLDPEVVHLNHGSYGAVPTPVLAAQRRAAEAVERSPEQFYRTELAADLDAVR